MGNLLRVSAAILVLSLAVAPALAEDLPGDGKSVHILMGQDMESLFQAEVLAIGLERLGYDVGEIDQVAPAIYFQSVAQGDADLNAQTWWPMHRALFEEAGGEESLELVGVLVHDAVQGYLIDKKTADAYGITDIGQLSDPELAKLFDSDGDGKANLAGCPPGWQCEATIDYHIQQYGLGDTVQQDKGDNTVLKSDVIARYQAGEPVLYYTWEPFWLSQVLVPGTDVQWLSVPFKALPAASDQEANTVTSDGRDSGWEVVDVRVTANKAFLAENPAAKRLFELAAVPVADINAENFLINEGENTPADVRRHAEVWVEENAATFDAWVEEARQAAAQ
jgi:glycine betaine/proline transport system substrate-binding protein